MIPLKITIDPSLIDSHVLIISIFGYCIVLLALSVMAYLMVRVHSLREFLAAKRRKRSAPAESMTHLPTVMTGEQNAAIATALYLFFSELHDQERYVMTIKKVSRTYSPWSSKIYNIWNNMKHW